MKRIALLFITFFASCSTFDGLPTEEMELNKVKQTQFNDRTNQFIDIIAFKKKDAVKQTIFGEDIYQFEYSLKIRFKINAHSIFSEDLKNFETDKEMNDWIYSHPMRSSSGDNYPDYYNKYHHYKKGQEIVINDFIEFQKKESGWN